MVKHWLPLRSVTVVLGLISNFSFSDFPFVINYIVISSNRTLLYNSV